MASSTASPLKTILTTGANRGLGFALIQALSSHSSTANKYHFLLGCRDSSAGEAAKSQLRDLKVNEPITVVQLDVTSDVSIASAASSIQQQFGGLDVLVNNAGTAKRPKDDLSDFRQAWMDMYNTNVVGVALTIERFLPLLRAKKGRVINISSARGSITRANEGKLPPDLAMGYGVSKAALNRMTVQFAVNEKERYAGEVEFQGVNPGHCKTAFNGYKGARDPVEGVAAVVELLGHEKGWKPCGFWETLGDERELVEVEW